MRAALRQFALLAAVIVAIAAHFPAAATDVRSDVRRYRQSHEKEILEEFSRLLAIPNVATNVPDIERNAAFLTAALEKRGLKTRLLSAGPGTPPAIFGELRSPGAKRTIVFYTHYDGQPAAKQAGWRSDPWAPVVRRGSRVAEAVDVDWRTAAAIDPEWRIYARSASDDKGPIQAMLSALDALRASGRKPAVNIKVFFEGEEEHGSRHLARILHAGKDLLKGDLFLLGDGPRHQSGRMQLFFGARGATKLDLTVYGPLRPLHDGHYGNWAPNPAVMLAHLLTSMRDEESRILIPGFYDDVRALTETERAALAALPDVETKLKQELALGRTEGTDRLADAVTRPALNIRGIRVGDVGDAASNTIFPEAKASFDFRLVPDQTPEKLREATEAFLRAEGWHVVHEEPSAELRAKHPKVVKAEWSLEYPGYRSNMDLPAARALIASLRRSTGSAPILIPMVGSSIAMHSFATVLQMPVVMMPIVNYDNNQHGANENLRLQNLWDGIEIYAGLLTELDW